MGLASTNLAASPDTGASDISNLGATSGWEVQSSATATQSGRADLDAGVQHLELAAGQQRRRRRAGHRDRGAGPERDLPGRHRAAAGEPGHAAARSSVFFVNNMQLCYGSMSKMGRTRSPPFDVPWWWRTDFTPNLAAGQVATLIVNGVIGSANVWVNGRRWPRPATVTGAYTRFTFNITGTGPAPAPTRWRSRSTPTTRPRCSPSTTWTGPRSRRTTTPASSSRSSCQVDGALAVGNSHVNQSDAADLSSAALTVKTDVTQLHGHRPDRHGDRDDHPAGQRHADHGQPDRDRAGQHDPDRGRSPRAASRPDDHQPAGMVALPARRAAALHAVDVGRRRTTRS